MTRDFKTKNGDGRFVLSKSILGIGLHINFIPAIAEKQQRFMILFDFLFIRVWYNNYKNDTRRNKIQLEQDR